MKYFEKLKENIGSFFNYETEKVVDISNWKMGLLNCILRLLILVYVICWVIIYDHGYQECEFVTSSVTTKVKGLLVLEYPSNISPLPRIADSADIVIPPIENNAFFVMTSKISTIQQTIGKCNPILDTESSSCEMDSDCRPALPITQEGINTGKCIENAAKRKTCEIYAWCPLENDTISTEHADELFNMLTEYTVYIKNDILFPKFGVKRNNRATWRSEKDLINCRYDPDDPVNKLCPIFDFNTIFRAAGITPTTVIKGGVIGIYIDWNCDLDFSVEKCNPTYTFKNMESSKSIHVGFNFRYGNYYRNNGTLYRDRIKVFGIRFPIFVSGTARRFDFIHLFLNVGSGMGLLSIAPSICDFVLLKLLKTRHIYKKGKIEYLQIGESQNSDGSNPNKEIEEDKTMP